MGLLNNSIINLHICEYGYWEFINVTERSHWMTLNTAFIHTRTSIDIIQHIAVQCR